MARSRLHALVVAGVLAASLAACGEDREGTVEVEGGTGTGTQTTGSGTQTTATTDTQATTETQAATTPTGDVARSFQVVETEFRLTPARFEIAKPGVVAFRVENNGATVHALEVEGPTGEFETEEIQPGGRATLRADVSRAGSYELYCPVGDHEDRGMVGTLVVR